MSRIIHIARRLSPVAFSSVLVVAAIVGVMTLAGVTMRSAPQKVQVVPPPSIKEAATGATSAVAVLAGGCFWGVQGVYEHMKGVTRVVSGYAGGPSDAAHYELVERGTTGHAEAVQITFDPHQVTYGRLLQVFFSVIHDPTELNRQGPDVGPQYRSAIFPANAEQLRIAKAYIAELNQARVFTAAIVTKIEGDRPFYAAEDYHQDFLERHPTHGYIATYDLPKLRDFKRLFPTLYRPTAVLVAAH